MLQTGSVVELEVAKQGAIFHGLATLLSQPSPLMSSNRSNPTTTMMMAQSKSTSALFQNQNNNFAATENNNVNNNNGHPTTTARSSSVQNLASNRRPPPPAKQQQQQHFDDSSQQFYQNVGPSSSSQQQHPFVNRHSSQSSLHHHNMPSPSALPPPSSKQPEIFHASPRVSGTPQTTNSHEMMLMATGPEKPLRHYYGYGGDNNNQEQIQTNLTNSTNSGVRKVSQQNGINRVRFQEPEEMNDVRKSSNSNDEIATRFDNLQVTSIEREFKRRVAEYTKDRDSISDSEQQHFSNNDRQSRLRQKQDELEALQRAESRLQQEAAERRRGMEGTTNFGREDTPPPPPPPTNPPPSETPSPPPPGTHRLDMLVGGVGVLKTNGSSKNDHASVNNTPTKRVSFMNNVSPSEGGGGSSSREGYDEHYDDDDHRTLHNEKLDRLERVEKDPNAFINEAESLLNSSTLALERFDFDKSTGHTPSVIGTQEVYRDPRTRRLQQAQDEKATIKQPDGAKLSFKEKMKLFALESGAAAAAANDGPIKPKAKISKAQREIDDDDKFS